MRTFIRAVSVFYVSGLLFMFAFGLWGLTLRFAVYGWEWLWLR